MDRPALAPPSPEEGLGLHLRLCDLDPVAPADLCAAYLPFLVQALAAGYPTLDPHLHQTAAEDALIGYLHRPQAYDPSRADLGTYLRMAARGDLLNLLAKERRHQEGRTPWSTVELGEEGGNISGGEAEPSALLIRAEEAARCRALLQSVRERCTEEEGQVLELLLAGERSNDAYARVLGKDGLPREERDREVKRAKDRIKKRLERGGEDHG